MKKLFIIPIAFLLNSCLGFDRETNDCFTNTIRILDKRTHTSRSVTYYEFYVYNGVEAKWYYTDTKTFNIYKKK